MKALWDSYSASAGLGGSLAAFSASRGIDVAPLAAAVDLDPAQFGAFRQRMSLEAFCALLDILATVSGDDCFGLNYAQAFDPKDLRSFAYAIMSAPTLRQAVLTYQKFQPLAVDTIFCDIEMGPEFTSFTWRYEGLISRPVQFADFRGALGCRFFATITSGAWRPSSVELIRESPRSPDLHRRLLHKDVRFGAAMNRIVFSSALLDMALPAADPRLFEMMTQACERELSEIEAGRDLRLLVKTKILAVLPTREVTLADVAAAMGLGDRTLQRRLADLGVTFEELLESTRADLSARLLATTAMPLAQISYLCGYANPSAYSRAAKGWHTMTPQAYRQSMTRPA